MFEDHPLPKAPPGYRVVDVNRAIDTFPLRGRIVAWLLYKTFMRKFSLRFLGQSPYTRVVATLEPIPPSQASSRTTQEKELQEGPAPAIEDAPPETTAEPEAHA
jgi:hypothetical protein